MPKDSSIRSVLIIGSGPIVIGQACEFDYSGSQAARSLREEGIEVTLINSNPATIMTDKVVADYVYLLPLEMDSIIHILNERKIDAVLPTMGGQTALNLAIQCEEAGVRTDFGVRMIGVDIGAINITENRELFRALMNDIGVPMAPQKTAKSFLEGKEIAQLFGFPICIRPSFTLGGSGAALVHNKEDAPIHMNLVVGQQSDVPAGVDLNFLGVKLTRYPALGQFDLSPVGKVREPPTSRHRPQRGQVFGVGYPLGHADFPGHIDKTLFFEIHRHIGIGENLLGDVSLFDAFLSIS